MFFSLKELIQWLGLTVFEIWIDLIAILIFTVLMAIKLEEQDTTLTWWIVFAPLFTADALNAYFCTIVLIRMYLESMYKAAFFRALWSFSFLSLIFLFQFLLCKKLSGLNAYDYSEIFTPIFILLMLMAVRTCQLH
ncbi:transmembrane protein 203 [Nilaparvata lugens]|uniref:transmembrane protein 203 n=1 Tax=Nilaparvata lugens TaxID=108931 RepID=UPI000B98623D|nr:transmembrane protein 203 [Nilaparvata lugens]